MRRAFVWIASVGLACGPSAETPDDAGDTETDGTPSGTTAVMTTVAATTGGPMDGSSTTDSPPGTSTGDPPGTSTGEVTGTTGVDSTGGTDTESLESTGEVGNGECVAHEDCPSGYCREFSDAPPDLESLCQEPPAGGNTRFTGTVRDIVTQQPVDGADLIVAGALQAASNPAGADAIVSATTDGDGQFDATSAMPLNQAIGAVAIASSAQHYLTETGLAGPNPDGSYPPGNTIHDAWVVATADLDTWSALLEAEGVAPDALPLGDEGGAVLVVRDPSGAPVAGALVSSTEGVSTAEVYYPSADGASLDAQTSELGLAIVVNPNLAEVFALSFDGATVGQISVVTVAGAVFTGGAVTD